MRNVVSPFLLSLALAACSSSSSDSNTNGIGRDDSGVDVVEAATSEGGGADSSADAAVVDANDCANYPDHCPTGCEAALGQPLDETHHCIGAEKQLGCRPVGQHLDGYSCIVDTGSGVAYRIHDGLTPVGAGWASSCTSAEASMASDLTVPACS